MCTVMTTVTKTLKETQMFGQSWQQLEFCKFLSANNVCYLFVNTWVTLEETDPQQENPHHNEPQWHCQNKDPQKYLHVRVNLQTDEGGMSPVIHSINSPSKFVKKFGFHEKNYEKTLVNVVLLHAVFFKFQ